MPEVTGLDQTTQGKAYEYACLMAVYQAANSVRTVIVVHNSSLGVAENAWGNLTDQLRRNMGLSARSGVEVLLKMEPKILEDGNDELELSLQEDKEGQNGDVRDVLIIRRNIRWEIGISVKHNHSAVKHSRLSPTIDFGRQWLGLSCNQSYFDAINPIFDQIRMFIAAGMKWSEIVDKNGVIYVPLLRAFKNELMQLNLDNGSVVPSRLLEYLLGRKDFYKIISHDTGRFTTLQCYNLHGTLNTASTTEAPALKVGGVSLPSSIYHFDFKQTDKGVESGTTLELSMDNGWGVSFRIHNASIMVEPSLKFDIQLTGVPYSMFSNSAKW